MSEGQLKELEKPVGDFVIKNGNAHILKGGAYYHYSDVCRMLKSYATQEVEREKREWLEKDYTPLIFRIAKEYSPDDPLERHHFIIGAMQVLNKLKEQ